VAISPKAFALLELLLDRAPDAVAKDEIQRSVWPKTFVTESNLTNLVSEIRAAVGDSASRPRFIRTVHRFGYRFQGEVVEEGHIGDSEALYRIILGNRRIALVTGENILGRHPDAQVRVDQTAVSRRHARIRIRAGKARLEDLQSRNGTFLQGRRLTAPAELHDGDSISLGPVRMIFRVFSSPASTEAGSSEGLTET